MTCLCASSRHVSRLLTRYYEKELAPANLSPAQFELLSTLNARPDVSQSDLAAALDLDQTTLSRNLKILLERQWIVRTTPEQNRRQAAYTLSREGEAVWRRALPQWQRAQAKMQENLDGEWAAVWSALERLTKAVPQ